MHQHRLHIAYPIQKGPWGGGNQFLSDLKDEWQRQGVYADTPDSADIVLFNAHHDPMRILELRRRFPQKTFIHRLAGILETQRGEVGRETDRMARFLSNYVADGLIFQSEWAKRRWLALGLDAKKPSVVIANAPDPRIFSFAPPKKPHSPIRLISTSWSSNPVKGFGVLKYLDTHLDFRRFSFDFIGKSPIAFKNIRVFPPQEKAQLAKYMQDADIFFTASSDDACSNSLVEALHLGLVVVARNSGGHPEIVMNRGLLFKSETDVLMKIEKAVESFTELSSAPLQLHDFPKTAALYQDFSGTVLTAGNRQRASWLGAAQVRTAIAWEKFYSQANWSMKKFQSNMSRLFASALGQSRV